MKESVLVD